MNLIWLDVQFTLIHSAWHDTHDYDWIIKKHVYTLVELKSNWVTRIKTPRLFDC